MEDIRFDQPLYTIGEAARILGVAPSTFSTWAKGYSRERPSGMTTVSKPIVSLIPTQKPHWPQVPFVGLVEGVVALAFRRAGVSAQHIRRALPIIANEMGIEHALASRGLRTDGARILFDYAHRAIGDSEFPARDELTVVVTQQRVFSTVVDRYLRRIDFGDDRWASRLILPTTEERVVELDPYREAGKPRFIEGGARVEHVLSRFRAGEPIADVARDFGVPEADVEAALRASLPPAA